MTTVFRCQVLDMEGVSRWPQNLGQAVSCRGTFWKTADAIGRVYTLHDLCCIFTILIGDVVIRLITVGARQVAQSFRARHEKGWES